MKEKKWTLSQLQVQVELLFTQFLNFVIQLEPYNNTHEIILLSKAICCYSFPNHSSLPSSSTLQFQIPTDYSTGGLDWARSWRQIGDT